MPLATPNAPAVQPKPPKPQPTPPAPAPALGLTGARASEPESVVDPLDRRGLYFWLACVGILVIAQLYQIMQYVFR
jgi:hypothetical protein